VTETVESKFTQVSSCELFKIETVPACASMRMNFVADSGAPPIEQINPAGAAIEGTETSKANVKRIVDKVFITNLPKSAAITGLIDLFKL
jgi:hypothetical protein